MRIVPPTGPTNRPLIAIVGEAPGAEEERLGRPFCGPSGHLLDQMLTACGILRGECYITNVAKVRPPGNNFLKQYYEDCNPKFPTQELVQLRQDLVQELRAIGPKIVVALGVEAMVALTGHAGIKNYRGTLMESQGLRVIPTYHPAYILRGMYEERPVVECDLRKAKRQALNPYNPPTRFNIDPTFAECMAFLRSRPPRVALDIETTHTNDRATRCVGFAWSKFEAISIPLMRGSSHAWGEAEEIEILAEMNRLLLDTSVEKIIQNQMYDSTVLAHEFGFHIRNVVMDTMVAHHLLYPELPKGLDFLSSIYTDHPMYWAKNDATYNCMDCIVTYEVAEEIREQLVEKKMWDFYQKVVQPTINSVLYVQSLGIKVDPEARAKVRETTVKEMDELVASVKKVCGEDFNPYSPKQVGEILYGKWNLPAQKNPKTKKVTTDDDALKALAKKNPHHAPTINAILACRQKRVLLSTFIDVDLKNGRSMTSYNVAGTVTGRLSSSSTFDGFGGNLQNIPRGSFRKQFVPDPGKVLIKADLSQAEYRVLIWKAKIQRVINRWLTEPGFNIHMWNASENIFRVPVDQVTKDMYAKSKNGVYGANYNIGYIKVSRMYNMDLREARFILERYHEAVPEVKSVYQQEIRDAVCATRELVNPLGRRRLFLGRLDDELYRAAYSHYCQSTVGDLINMGLVDLLRWSFDQPELGLDILLQVHDELVCQCWEAHAETCVGLIRRALERPIMVDDNPVPLVIPCEIKLGPNWYDTMPLDKWKEEHGKLELPQEVLQASGAH